MSCRYRWCWSTTKQAKNVRVQCQCVWTHIGHWQTVPGRNRVEAKERCLGRGVIVNRRLATRNARQKANVTLNSRWLIAVRAVFGGRPVRVVTLWLACAIAWHVISQPIGFTLFSALFMVTVSRQAWQPETHTVRKWPSQCRQQTIQQIRAVQHLSLELPSFNLQWFKLLARLVLLVCSVQLRQIISASFELWLEHKYEWAPRRQLNRWITRHYSVTRRAMFAWIKGWPKHNTTHKHTTATKQAVKKILVKNLNTDQQSLIIKKHKKKSVVTSVWERSRQKANRKPYQKQVVVFTYINCVYLKSQTL